MSILQSLINSDILIAMVLGALAVILSCLFHYEILHLLQTKLLDKMAKKPLRKFLLLTIVLFSAHTLEVWLYMFVYLGLNYLEMGSLMGLSLAGSWSDYLYFSTASYTTLGVGDIYPTGAMRLITGIEAVNGLMLVAWSATFFYFHMEKRWLGIGGNKLS